MYTIDLANIPGVEINPLRMSGRPVLQGRRFTLAQVVAELVDNRTLAEIADDHDLNLEELRLIFSNISVQLDKTNQPRHSMRKSDVVISQALV